MSADSVAAVLAEVRLPSGPGGTAITYAELDRAVAAALAPEAGDPPGRPIAPDEQALLLDVSADEIEPPSRSPFGVRPAERLIAAVAATSLHLANPAGATVSVRGPSPSATLAPRPFERNPEVAKRVVQMKADALSTVASTVRIEVANAVLRALPRPKDEKEAPQRYRIEQSPAADTTGQRTLDLTLLVHVSGHTGQAAEFARSNRYDIQVTLPDGTEILHSGVRNHAAGVEEYVTVADLSVPLQPGRTVIRAWPQQSAGAGGYNAGRTIELEL